ncbi:uncharacterized protein G2W53_032639 [Senna tora]|uniref:Uncharacterized protein n=1 Tax=Senna tora TaxID=362788 RepID=A0A834SXV9_9FABA|nr:uncharacterized protein G2W53_032639 [Senna tora]
MHNHSWPPQSTNPKSIPQSNDACFPSQSNEDGTDNDGGERR